jgi:hypothetical protein
MAKVKKSSTVQNIDAFVPDSDDVDSFLGEEDLEEETTQNSFFGNDDSDEDSYPSNTNSYSSNANTQKALPNKQTPSNTLVSALPMESNISPSSSPPSSSFFDAPTQTKSGWGDSDGEDEPVVQQTLPKDDDDDDDLQSRNPLILSDEDPFDNDDFFAKPAAPKPKPSTKSSTSSSQKSSPSQKPSAASSSPKPSAPSFSLPPSAYSPSTSSTLSPSSSTSSPPSDFSSAYTDFFSSGAYGKPSSAIDEVFGSAEETPQQIGTENSPSSFQKQNVAIDDDDEDNGRSNPYVASYDDSFYNDDSSLSSWTSPSSNASTVLADEDPFSNASTVLADEDPFSEPPIVEKKPKSRRSRESSRSKSREKSSSRH